MVGSVRDAPADTLNKQGGAAWHSFGLLLITLNVWFALALAILKSPVGKVTWIITGINLRDVLAKTNGAFRAGMDPKKP